MATTRRAGSNKQPPTIAALLGRTTSTATAALLAALLITIVMAVLLVGFLHPSVDRYTDVSRELRIAHYAMLDKETSLRGYLLSGDREFLRPYETGTQNLAPAMESLGELIDGDERLSGRWSEMQRLQRAWDDEWVTRALELGDRLAVDPDTVVEQQFLNDGRDRFDAYRNVENEITADVVELRDTAIDNEGLALVVGLSTQVTIVLVAVVLARSGTRRLQRAIARPLQELVTTMSRIGSGEFTAQAAFDNGPSELRRLATSLAEMTEALAVARDELRDARDKADEASKMKSEFLANMSHEIRTPLNGVIGMAGLLLESNLSSSQRELAETVRSSGDALLVVINDILDFSKIEAGHLDIEEIDFDIRKLAEEVTDLVAPAAHAKQLELAVLVHHGVPHALRGDPSRLRQVINNLLSNAIKFTEVGEVVLEIGSNDGTTGFEVRDTGIGISDEHRTRLFGAFEQADASTTRRYGGTGLGLAISSQLVRLMGGTLEVESEIGRGSAFSFRLHLAEGEYVEPRRSTDFERLNVLVVDDNATNRRILELRLKEWGLQPVICPDAASALRAMNAANAQRRSIEAVILDGDMPVTDGYQLARQIVADPTYECARIIMLTSVIERERFSPEVRKRVIATLTKPARESALFDALATIAGASEAVVEADEVLEQMSVELGTVLIAEDNPTNQRVASLMVERVGYRSVIVSNGREVLEALRGDDYDLVLMDCQMPEVDGYEATRRIRAGEVPKSDVPIIAMTAGAMVGEREKCLDAGMDEYVTKPVRREQLAELIRHFVTDREASVPVVDTRQFRELRELTQSNLTLQEMLVTFYATCDDRLGVLDQAAASGDLATFNRLGHSLAGGAGTFGATRLAAAARDAETCPSADTTTMTGLSGRLRQELADARAELDRLID